MRGRRTDPTIKAQVMAALLMGQSVMDCVRTFSVEQSLVSRWKKELPKKQFHDKLHKKENDRRHWEIELDELLINCVRAILRTVTSQCEEVGRAEYIKRQSASEIAVLAGVLTDKAIRILSAYEPLPPEPLPDGASAESGEEPLSVH